MPERQRTEESTGEAAGRTSAQENRLRDLRETSLWKEAEKHYDSILAPSYGKISGATDLHFPLPFPSPVSVAAAAHATTHAQQILFTGTLHLSLAGIPTPTSRICTLDIATQELRTITSGGYGNGKGADRGARWRGDGRSMAFLSNRADVKGVVNNVYVLDVGGLGEARLIECDDSGESKGGKKKKKKNARSSEWLQWSPDSKRVLVRLAGAESRVDDASGKMADAEMPAWMPIISISDVNTQSFRSLALWEVGKETMQPLSLPSQKNIWEASWLGNDKIIALVSDTSDEASWYGASLSIYDLKRGTETQIAGLENQHALPVGSPSGERWACIQSLCSDRGVVAGDILYGSSGSTKSDVLEVQADVTYLAWRDDDTLFWMGNQSLNSVAGEVTFSSSSPPASHQTWLSPEAGGFVGPAGTLLPNGQFALPLQSWVRSPEIGIVSPSRTISTSESQYTTLKSFSDKGTAYLSSLLGPQTAISWTAPDGLEIQGFLSLPRIGTKPYPLILNVHGGPVYSWRNTWGGDSVDALLNARGFALLSSNPRGSSSRGQAFIAREVEDIGGLETQDHFSGIDKLVKEGIADPERLGVMGGSHGGFMTNWIIGQEGGQRFKAAVAVAAVNDWHSMHTTSNVPPFTSRFFGCSPYSLSLTPQKSSLFYLSRSPTMHTPHISTPVLQIAGTDDATVDSSQALQFHNALKEHGKTSVLAMYPGEGHGVAKFPAKIDVARRTVGWFEGFLGSVKG